MPLPQAGVVQKQLKEGKSLAGLRAGGQSLSWPRECEVTGHAAIHGQPGRKMNALAKLTV